MHILQALPGSRLDSSLFKEWLVQHLNYLHSCQSAVIASEFLCRQKRHAAAAEAAVQAVQLALNKVAEEDADSQAASTDNSQVLRVDSPSRNLPAQVIAAAAEAAVAAATAADSTSQVEKPGPPVTLVDFASRIGKLAGPQLQPKEDMYPQTVSDSCREDQTGSHMAKHLKHVGQALKGSQSEEFMSVGALIRRTALNAQGLPSQEVVQKELQVMSLCFEGLCHEVSMSLVHVLHCFLSCGPNVESLIW